jgi:hypothetical protein
MLALKREKKCLIGKQLKYIFTEEFFVFLSHSFFIKTAWYPRIFLIS